MRTGLLFFALGLIAGYFLHSVVVSRPVLEPPPSGGCAVAPESAASPVAPTYAKLDLKTGSSLLVTQADPSGAKESADASRARPVEGESASGRRDRTLGLVLDEPTVREWERRLSELRSRVAMEEVGEGWRVRIDQADPLISRTGLQDGDLITHESVRSQLAMAERAPVMNRFLAVLRALQR